MNRPAEHTGSRLLMVNSLLLAMGIFATLSIFLGGFGYPYFWLITGIAMAMAGGFYLLYNRLQGKTLRWVLLGMLAAWVLAGLLLRTALAQGAEVAFRYIIPYLFKIMTYDFGEVLRPDSAGELACAGFIIYLLVPYMAALVRVVVFRRSAVMGILLTALPAAFALLICELPSSPVLVIALAFWITLIFRSRIFRRNQRSEITVSLLTLVASVVALSAMFFAYPRQNYEENPAAFARRDELIDFAVGLEDLGIFDDFQGYISGAPLTASNGTVNLNTMGRLRFSDKDILRVYSSRPRTIYLRGYSASVYDGNKWTQGDEDVLLQTGINFQPMLYLAGPGKDVADSLSGLQFATSVEMLRSKSNYVFAPYNLADVRSATEAPQWQGDTHLVPSEDTTYSFTSYFDGYKNVITMPYSDEVYTPNISTGEVDYRGDTLIYHVGNGLSLEGDGDADVDGAHEFFMSDQDEVDTLETFYPQDSQDAAYIKYIVEEYTKLPDGLAETLLGWRAEQMGKVYDQVARESMIVSSDNDFQLDYRSLITNYNHGKTPFWEWADTAGSVANMVRSSGKYNTNPGFQPVNRDFIEYFLTERHEGYCVHFASSTVAILRALGIPARYAEGYVVGESLFSSNGWATVPAKNAHTWAEIWLPGIGWTPVESTPGGTAASYVREDEEDTMAAALQPTPSPTSQPTNTPATTPRATSTPANTQPLKAAAGTEQGGGSWPLMAAGLLLAGLVGVLLIRIIGKQLRERRFGDSDTNKAAAYVYTYLARLAEHGADISDTAKQLAAKARFSQHTINEVELGNLKAEFYLGRKKLRSNADGRTKLLLWMQFI